MTVKDRILGCRLRIRHTHLDAEAALIEVYLPYAKNLAAGLYANRPDNEVPFEDYLQWASLGLIESVKRFDESRRVEFKTFANLRIRGSVLNGLEKATERRHRAAFVRRNRRDLVESAHELSTPEKGGSLFGDMVELTVKLAIGFMLEDTGVADSSGNSDTALNSRALDELSAKLQELLQELPDSERLVLRYHYFYRVPFKDLAGYLGVTKGRISQIHRAALERLRANLVQGSALDDYL